MPEEREKPDQKSLTLRMEKELWRRIKMEAVNRETTITEVILQAIREKLLTDVPDEGRKGGMTGTARHSVCAR